MIRAILSVFAWRLVRHTGNHAYLENAVTGERHVLVFWPGDIDHDWLAGPVEISIPRPADMTEDQILEAIGSATQEVIVGTGDPDSLGLYGDRDQVEVAVQALETA